MLADKYSIKEILMLLANRPGMYVGKNRFDYILCFIDGATIGPQLFFPQSQNVYKYYNWQFDYDVQKWLFLNESASLNRAVTLHGWSLMQRCYGNRQKTFEQFKRMLDEIPFSNGEKYDLADTVSWYINQIYSIYKYDNIHDILPPSHNKVSSSYYPVSSTIKDIIGEVQYNYESIISLVERMFNVPCKNLQIYLHYERYFLCVRFLFCSEKGEWIENTALTHLDNYYNNLVILHSYSLLIQKEEHSNHIITISSIDGKIKVNCEEIEDIWYGIINNDIDISMCDKNPFCRSYSKWKEKAGIVTK